MRPVPRFYHLIPHGPSIPHHERHGREQRAQPQLLDKQHICSSRRCEFEGVGVVGAGVPVEGGVEDSAEAGGAGGLLSKLGGAK